MTSATPVKASASPIVPVSGGALVEPQTPHASLAGVVRVEPDYAIAHAGARRDGEVVSFAGGAVISDHGAGVIAANGGGIVSNNGGSVLSDLASQLLGDADAGVVANDGGGLVGNNGGALIGKVKYRLAEASDGLPAAGMAVFVLDPRTGAPLPVGVDAAGAPQYVVYTGADGRYQLYPPQGLARNVRVVAVAPRVDDARLVYNLLTPAAGKDVTVDEDAALATRFARGTFEAYMTDRVLTHQDFGAAGAAPDDDVIGQIVQKLADVGVRTMTRRQLRAVSQAVADAICAYADLESFQTNNATTFWTGPPEPAMAAIRAFVHETNAEARKRLAASPNAFDDLPFYALAGGRRAFSGEPPFVIARPADLNQFIFHEYLDTSDKYVQRRLANALTDMGLPATEYDHLRAAYNGVFSGLIQLLILDDGARAAALAAIDPAAKAARRLTEPSPSPTPDPWAGATVSTIAGSVPGNADGPGASATFTTPAGLAYDGDHTLYVAEINSHRVRAIDLADPAHPVRTVAGGSGQGSKDGPGPEATLSSPCRLLYDGKTNPPRLFVGQIGDGNIRQIDLPAGGPAQVTTLAGDGKRGYQDGPGAQAEFKGPNGLALEGAGRLLVADFDNDCIRAIDLINPAHTVSTVIGPKRDASGLLDKKPGEAGPVTDVLPQPDGGYLVLRAGELERFGPDLAADPVLLAGGGQAAGDGFGNGGGLSNASVFLFDTPTSFYLVENTGRRVRRGTLFGNLAAGLRTLAGPAIADPVPPTQFVDGPVASARFGSLNGLALDRDGVLYVSDTENCRIRAIRRI